MRKELACNRGQAFAFVRDRHLHFDERASEASDDGKEFRADAMRGVWHLLGWRPPADHGEHLAAIRGNA
jgi:hypothetical protein